MSGANRLARESSPYLRQHSANPVDWFPWGDEAFATARQRDVPILLSVGYSACHWCHVMAHESFEDPATARVMNRLFVNVKVDREERPDVDAIYMEAVMAMTGSGGWPMTVVLDPDGRPFFGGTYFPKSAGHGRPGFVQLLEAIDEAWRLRRPELLTQAGHLCDAIRQRSQVVGPDPDDEVGLSPGLVDAGCGQLIAAFDAAWGGFGGAPKFPMTTNLELLLRAAAGPAVGRERQTQASVALDVVVTTLDAMACGGIYDHLGGGFARYSVDRQWLVPHFEKMLYDNALIPRPYLHAWQVTGEPRHRQVVEETVSYVLRDLRSPDGGLYSAEDADAEGVEGKFSVWRAGEIRSVLEQAGLSDSAPEIMAWYGVSESGNFEGVNILFRPERGDIVRPPSVEQGRQALFSARSQRVHPGLDDKVVTEWNAMFVATLAEAGAAFVHRDWLASAEETADFLLRHLRRADGRWLRAWQVDGEARHLAYAVDYAHLIDAFTRLAEATGHARWIAEARRSAAGLLDLFWDDADGGLFTVGHDAEQLIVRSKDVYDGATPSANSVAALSLLRLGALTAEQSYTDAALGILRLLHAELTGAPRSVTHALAAADLAVTGITEVVVTSDRPDLVAAVQGRYLPDAVLAWGEPFPSPLWEGREQPAAYVCRNYACGLPANTTEELAAQLSAGR